MGEDDKRKKLLAAAWELFTNSGYKATTIDMIAKAAGMAKGSFYLHFQTKDDVLFALVDGAATAMAASADELLADPRADVPGVIQKYLDGIMAYRENYRMYRNLVFEAKTRGTASVVEAVSRLDRRFEEELARMFRAFSESGLIGPCDCETVALVVLEAYSALIERRDRDGNPLSAERVKSCMTALLYGGLISPGAREEC